MVKFNYIPIQLIIPEGKISKRFREGCEYVNIGYYLKRNYIIGNLAESFIRGPDLTIWEDISADNGKYLFEVIVELPFFLPNFKKSYEYDLSMGERKYFINNRHCEIITFNKEEYLFAHINSIPSLLEQGIEINQIVKLKTLISSIFIEESDNASDVIENKFYNWVEIFSNDISQIVLTLRYCSSRLPELIPDCTNVGNTCPIYVLCKGEEGKISILKFIKHVNVSPLQPISHIEKTTKPIIEKYLAGDKTFDEGKHLLLKSKQLYESGEYHSCCIIACTACEVIMTRHLKNSLAKKGLGKNKIKDAIDNLTFSQLIKLTSNFVYPVRGKIKEALNKINKVRKIRNNIVHEGRQLIEEDILLVKDSIGCIELISKYRT